MNIEERKLRKRLSDAERERNQMVIQDPIHTGELEIEVRRLAWFIKEMQGRWGTHGWRIIWDNESMLSVEIMNIVIPRDFDLLNLHYSKRSNLLMHIEQFNEVIGARLDIAAKV